MFSSRYIYIYSSVMVIVVAALLAATANLLKPYQDKNIRAEKIQNILAAAGVVTSRAEAEDLYKKYILEEIVIDREGNVLSVFKDSTFQKGNIRAFNVDLKEELKKLEEHQADSSKPAPVFPLFVFSKEGTTEYIVPVLGKGLWGPIYGNIAFKSDMNTIAGANFGHDKETPGLGAEIALPPFQKQFVGKTIFDANGNFTSIKVVKGGVANSNIDPAHGVDAISGGTITSNGVTEMLRTNLENYVQYFKNMQNQ
jgi:Na+-transporting NADH:ubiquinone oxidoreductase subunit C